MVPIQRTRIAMDNLKPDNGNPLKSDSKTGIDIVLHFMKPKHSKSWDMRYHWLEECTKMFHLNTYWEQGINNWAGYFKKHHPPAYHNIIRYEYLKMVHMVTNKFPSSHVLPFAPHATNYTRVC